MITPTYQTINKVLLLLNISLENYVSTSSDGYDYNIKWESRSTNIGLDFGFMNDKISGSVDYYVKETSDLLATVPVVAGTNLPILF